MPHDRVIAVYMLANRKHGALYTGVTSDIVRRVHEHRIGTGSPFTRKYAVTTLVWYEVHDWDDGARVREKWIKAWRRAWKTRLIEARNPEWIDLYPFLNGGVPPELNPPIIAPAPEDDV